MAAMSLALRVFCSVLLQTVHAASKDIPPPSAAPSNADDECSVANGGAGCDQDHVPLMQLKSKHVMEGAHHATSGSWTDYLSRVTQSGGSRSQEGRSTSQYEECHLKESKCPMSAMGGKPTLVYPGGATRCINGDAYAFAVVPGDTDKLLFYFEGGGACWEAKGNVVLQCTDSIASGIATTGLGSGIQDRSNENNPLRSYTVVEAIYCAGDAFMGTMEQNWTGSTYYQYGYHNAVATIDWAKENIVGQLSSLVIAGYSAGSLGTMAWSGTLLQTFSYEKATVLLDSYAGIFPPGTQGQTLQSWGACKTGLWSSKVQAECDEGTMHIQDPFKEAMAKFPDVAFGSIQSKVDSTQVFFYKGMAQSNFMFGADGAGLSDEAFYAKSLEMYQDFNTYPNYAEFFVEGWQHCFTQSQSLFNATTAGPEGGAGQRLDEWLKNSIDQTAASACSGPMQSPNVSSGYSYCDQSLYPKVVQVSK